MPTPSGGNLPKEQTGGEIPLEVTGVDYPGPIYFKGNGRAARKSYIIVYNCSLMRGLHLEVFPDTSCVEFLMSLKTFNATKGHSKKILSDNGITFVTAARRPTKSSGTRIYSVV